MLKFKAEMHKIQFQLGLRPRPRWGSLQRSPKPLAVFEGPTSKGRNGEDVGKGRRGKGEGKRREKEGKGGKERGRPSKYLGLEPPVDWGECAKAKGFLVGVDCQGGG